VHAGWPGLAGGILARAVAAVRRLAGAGAPVAAALGPSAGPCCYEVGDDLRARFGTSEATLDLPGIAAGQLHAAGVDEVHRSGVCTMCAPAGLLFSHRRDGAVTGRQAGIAWRR
jgi:copper oxidase (laccase) domain-containing protein